MIEALSILSGGESLVYAEVEHEIPASTVACVISSFFLVFFKELRDQAHLVRIFGQEEKPVPEGLRVPGTLAGADLGGAFERPRAVLSHATALTAMSREMMDWQNPQRHEVLPFFDVETLVKFGIM